MNPTAFLAVILCASLAFAETPLDSTKAHRIEANFSLTGHFGDITEEDEDFYREVGLQVIDKDGTSEAVEASALGVGLSLAYWRLTNSKVELGAGYQFVRGTEKAVPAVEGEEGKDLFQRHTVTARARLLPVEVNALRVGLEVATGYGFGTLHRYSLAADQVNLLTSGVGDPATRSLIRSYILEANEPIGVRGPHFELHLVSSNQINESVNFLVKLGYDVTLWSITESDPLDARVRKYPSSISSQGFGLQMGFGGSF